MASKTCLSCFAPFYFEANVGATSVSVNKTCDCGSVPVEAMLDTVAQLTAVREFLSLPC